MKHYSFLTEGTQLIGNIYHYEESLPVCKLILNSGRLISASYMGTKDDKYKSRAEKFHGDMNKYFEDRYNKHYKSVLNKPYSGDYGIYFSSTDFFKMDLSRKYLQSYRFKIDIMKLIGKYDILWQEGKLGPFKKKIVKKINSFADYVRMYNNYLNKLGCEEEQEVKETIDSGIKLMFLRLPQIIVFAGKDGIPVKPSNLEKK